MAQTAAAAPVSGQRWLWISAEVPELCTTGLHVYSGGLSNALVEQGIDMTMVGLGPSSVERPGIDVRPVDGRLQGGWKSLFSALPNLSFACDTPAMRAAVADLVAAGGWDAIVIDHLQVGWALDLLEGRTRSTTVFVTHNHESSMRWRTADAVPAWKPRGVALRLDAVKATRLEIATTRRVSVVTSITEADQRRFEVMAPAAEHVLVKPGWSGELPASVPPMADRARRVGIVGSFEWHVKQENLLRLARQAGPALADAGIELAVAGSVPDPLRERLATASPAVRCIGWVDSVADFLGGCRLGVVAEPLGGGFKLKSLDYVAHRVPIAATAGSLPGLDLVPGESVIEADSERELGLDIVRVIDDIALLEKTAAEAFSACAPTLRWEGQVLSLLEAVSRADD